MAKKFKFRLNQRGVRALMKSEEMVTVLNAHANATAAAAGDGYEVLNAEWNTRKIATVRAATEEARQDNYDNNTLLKALQ